MREWYEPVAKDWLAAAASSGQVRLIIDGTKVSFHHQLLMVAVCYKGRALPIAWTWVGHSRGHSGQHQQLALLEYVRKLLPVKAKVCLVGDTEFGHTLVLENLDHWCGLMCYVNQDINWFGRRTSPVGKPWAKY